MERYHPRAGLWCLVVALPTWVVFLFNGMLGFFPAVIFAEGGVGQKFHFWLFILDKLGLYGGSPNPVWSEAGTMTSQEWILLILALGASIGAVYCLRKRPEFGAIQKHDEFSERESLEMGAVSIISSGGGDAHTKSIVESVIGEIETLDQDVVSAALGEMGVIAAANAAEEKQDEEDTNDDEEPIMDSRFTTTVPDDETLEMVSKYTEDDEGEENTIEDEDDIGWGVWDPDAELEEEVEEETETVIEVTSKRELPEIPMLFQEPKIEPSAPVVEVVEPEVPAIVTPTPVVELATPELPTIEMPTPNIVEDAPQRSVRKSSKGVMPVRPTGLPAMAEWDPYQGTWTIMGRPVKVAEKPEEEPDTPSWTQESVEIDLAPVTQPTSVDESTTPVRKTPFIPELP